MEEILKAIVLGVVQGLTEFLPVSSTGHLILTEELLGLSEDQFGLSFNAAIHLGTLVAVLVYFKVLVRDVLIGWIGTLKARKWDATPDGRLAWLIIIGTIPAAIAGILIESTAESTFRSPGLVAVMLILFCLPMLAAERLGKQTRDLNSATPADALIMGIAQSMALIPGVSRSGITISAAMFAGFRREQAAVFTFLLSAPIIAAAGSKQIFDVVRGGGSGGEVENAVLVYGAGLISAGLVGYAAIAFLVRFLRGNPLNIFIAYRVVLGITIVGLVATNVL